MYFLRESSFRFDGPELLSSLLSGNTEDNNYDGSKYISFRTSYLFLSYLGILLEINKTLKIYIPVVEVRSTGAGTNIIDD